MILHLHHEFFLAQSDHMPTPQVHGTRSSTEVLLKLCPLQSISGLASAAKNPLVVGGFLSLVACTDYSTHEVLV